MGLNELIPEGFRPIKWADVKNGQQVWLRGTDGGPTKAPRAYGPHTVVDKQKRKLKSPNEVWTEFTYYPEELLYMDRKVAI